MADSTSPPRRAHPPFDRARPALGCSLARWRHRKDQAELNQQFWIAVLEKDILLQRAAHLADDSGPPTAMLQIRSDADGHVGHNIDEMRRRAKATNSWDRLFTLLMAISALERYMLAVATAAIESDPLRISGFPKMMDGAIDSRCHGEDSPRIGSYGHLACSTTSRSRSMRN
jgi:hypothetical protein